MAEREDDIQAICKAVLETAIQEYYSSDLGDHYCVFCGSEGSRENIVHRLDCPVLIAKDLRAGA